MSAALRETLHTCKHTDKQKCGKEAGVCSLSFSLFVGVKGATKNDNTALCPSDRFIVEVDHIRTPRLKADTPFVFLRSLTRRYLGL